jgi:hypothetical protein
MASILKVDTIQDQSGNNIINESADTITIGASGDTITVPTGASMTGQNYPAFEAYLSADQSISDDVQTKLQANTEIFDTDSCYDNTTNYRFTPNIAGKYFVYGTIRFNPNAVVGADYTISIYKNGINYSQTYEDPSNDILDIVTLNIYNVIDMNGTTDYVELFGRLNQTSGTGVFANGSRSCNFGAYRIGA